MEHFFRDLFRNRKRGATLIEMACAVGLIAMIALPALKYLGNELQGIFSSIDAGFDSVVSDTTTKAEWHPKYMDYDDNTGGLYIYNDSGVAIHLILSFDEPEISVIDDFVPAWRGEEPQKSQLEYLEEILPILFEAVGIGGNASWSNLIEWIRQQGGRVRLESSISAV